MLIFTCWWFWAPGEKASTNGWWLAGGASWLLLRGWWRGWPMDMLVGLPMLLVMARAYVLARRREAVEARDEHEAIR